VPHQYDSVTQTWQIYASGVDAITRNYAGGNPNFNVVVLGSQVSIAGTAPVDLASAWSNLPDSFTLGLDGVASDGTTLYLFRHGRYLAIDPSTNAASGAPTALTSLTNWPTTPDCQIGVIDAVGSNPYNTTNIPITLWASDEYLTVDLTVFSALHQGIHQLEI
jgi:hypothetical protein